MIKKIQKKELKNFEEKIFFFGYFLLVVAEMLNNLPIINKNHDLIILIGIIIIIFYNCITFFGFKLNKKEKLWIISISVFCFIEYFFSRNFTILKYIIIMISTIEIKFDKFIKNDLIIKTVLTILVFLLYCMNFLLVTEFNRVDGSIRYSLGFNHPNTLGMYLMVIALEFLYLNKNKLKPKHIILAIIIGLFILIFPKSRTSALIIFSYLIYMLLKKVFTKFLDKNIIKNILSFIVPILTLISIILAVGYRVNYFNNLNNLLSNRLNYYFGFLVSYKPTLLGATFDDRLGVITLDNSYLFLILQFGLIIFFWFCAISIKGLKKIAENKNYDLFILLEIIFIYGMMEIIMLNVTINPFLIGLNVFYNEKKGEKNE